MGDRRTRRWQAVTLGTLVLGYAGYYVCRSNLSVATPLLLAEFGGLGVTKADIGAVASAGVFLYAVGKVSNGLLGDFVGGRALFLLGMAASAVCTALFGLAGGLAAFALTWAANRYVQSMGWGALVKIAARWFPPHRHATAMAVLSMSYLFGDAAARLYLGLFMEAGLGWRGLFFLAAGTLGGVALLCGLTLRASPRDVGCEEPAASPGNLFGAGGDSPRPPGLGPLLRPLLGSLTFWLACAMSLGLTLIREAFTFWTPTYLREVAGLGPASAAQGSLFFPLVGAASALAAGLLSDRLRGRHGRVIVPSLALLVGALGLLAGTDCAGRPLLALLLVGGVAFFLMAPYSFCAGVIALDLGGKRGSATAAGLIDSAGYLGAVFSGYGVGRVADTRGWAAAFGLLAVAAGLTLLAAALYWVRQEFGRDRPGARPAPGEVPP
jgi:OPA family glycerol-3-phosphate transporter-like MFS transporter